MFVELIDLLIHEKANITVSSCQAPLGHARDGNHVLLWDILPEKRFLFSCTLLVLDTGVCK